MVKLARMIQDENWLSWSEHTLKFYFLFLSSVFLLLTSAVSFHLVFVYPLLFVTVTFSLPISHLLAGFPSNYEANLNRISRKFGKRKSSLVSLQKKRTRQDDVIKKAVASEAQMMGIHVEHDGNMTFMLVSYIISHWSSQIWCFQLFCDIWITRFMYVITKSVYMALSSHFAFINTPPFIFPLRFFKYKLKRWMETQLQSLPSLFLWYFSSSF